MAKIINPIKEIDMPKNRGAIIPPISPSRRVIITNIKRDHSNIFGIFILYLDFNICGANISISRNIFVDTICQRWLKIPLIKDKTSISFMDKER